jgi:ppGpp synthetase/RelA/SpoT-type nucleotidyltranferase
MESEPGTERKEEFDFEKHANIAVAEYLQCRDFYKDLALSVRRILEEGLATRGVYYHSIQARAKTPDSFRRKAALPSQDDPDAPKYIKPLSQITDLAGLRIITYFPKTLDEVDAAIRSEFIVVEWQDKGKALLEKEKFGYQSIHYLVKLSGNRYSLPEYERYKDSIVEIQARTVLQHAWAEIEHDIQYKSTDVIPSAIRRRFISLAGLLEIADREFQAIQNADAALREEAREKVESDDLETVEITQDSLRAYLNRRLGEDLRISAWSYNWTARLLRHLGFQTLEQVDECVREYDDDAISRTISGGRQGQTTRFEYLLLAALGERYIERHIWKKHERFRTGAEKDLEKLRVSGLQTGKCSALIDASPDEEDPAFDQPGEIEPIEAAESGGDLDQDIQEV